MTESQNRIKKTHYNKIKVRKKNAERKGEKVRVLLYVTTCFTLRTERETGCDIKEKGDLKGDKSGERLSQIKTRGEEKEKLINATGRRGRFEEAD